jgi:hypothetical protein
MILKTVAFPTYLHGGIKGRGQASNARSHVGKRFLFSEDVENFFPSVQEAAVFGVWRRFFGFSPEVAECLTKLTTKDGALPQGAKTSPLLANILFWEFEPDLVRALNARGIEYTRLVDDITCSSSRELSVAEYRWARAKIREMVSALGLRLKTGKGARSTAAARMLATKLVVNRKTSLPAEMRSRVRAAVGACEQMPAEPLGGGERFLNRTSGQVSYLSQHHPEEGLALRRRLNVVKKNSNAEVPPNS